MFCVEFHTVQKNLLIVFQKKKKISKNVSNAYVTSLNLHCGFLICILTRGVVLIHLYPKTIGLF